MNTLISFYRQLMRNNTISKTDNHRASNMDDINNKPLITQFREGNRFMRVTASIVLACFAVVFYSPAVNATVKTIEEYYAYKPDYPVFGEMDAALAETQQLLKQLNAQIKQSKPTLTSKDPVANQKAIQAARLAKSQVGVIQKAIKQQYTNFVDLDDDANDYFDEQRDYYEYKKLPQKTITELDKKQQRYQREMTTLQDQLQRVSRAVDDRTLQQEARLTTALLDRLYNPVHHPYDQTMPFGPLDTITGAPKQTPAELQTLLGAPATGAPVAADTAATLDAQLTPAIQAHAASLNNDAVAIYNWVYNNIEFIPSYGSLQGADYTLQTLRGNAFDQSSLLIALLRAANIPARYVYGTIVVTNDEAMNWVGGVREPAAAQNLMSQGGIPSARLEINGANDFMTLEHVWVQVWDGSQWLEVDPGYKQYQYTEGMDLQSQVPFDAEAFATTLQSTAVVNETEGWVQNVNQAFIETELDDYRQTLETYLTNQQPNATVGDVIGSKQIIETTATDLPSTLPYERLIISQAIAEVPDSLRYKFTFELQDTFGGALLAHTANTTELAGQPLAISFNPATAADEQALLDYLPADPQTADDLPSIIPAGLMDVVGEFTIDGQVIESSAAMSFGQVLQTEKGYFIPGRGWSTTVNPIITGEYQAIGLDYHGVSKQQGDALQANLSMTRVKLDTGDIVGLSKHEAIGDLLQSGVMSYFALTEIESKLAAQTSGIIYYREPSYGTFQTDAKTNGLLGSVENVEMTGMLMDMDSMKFSTECKSNCWGMWRDFNENLGRVYSGFEHLVPEQLFFTGDAVVEGISAVKALALASQQGQRVYTFTQDNLAYLSDLTVDQGTIDEIQAQVQAGMIATIHQHPITHAGWTGVGYTIVDPETGAGGYKISGGSDGGVLLAVAYLFFAVSFVITLLFAASAVAVGTSLMAPILLAGAGTLFSVFSFASTVDGFINSFDQGDISKEELENVVNTTAIINILASIAGIRATANPGSLTAQLNPWAIGVVDYMVNFLFNAFISLRSA